MILSSRTIKSAFGVIVLLLFCGAQCVAQKGKADADFYPLGYEGETWTGEVTAFDNNLRTLTLASLRDKKDPTFVAYIPETPYERRRDARNFRVIDLPFVKTAKYQTFKWVGKGEGAGDLAPPGIGAGIQQRPNPPDGNVIDDLSSFLGRPVTVYYSTREREVNGQTVKVHEVWRIRILPTK